MSETSTQNAMFAASYEPTAFEMAQNSAHMAAQLAHAAAKADQSNLENLRTTLACLSKKFADHSSTMLDLHIADAVKINK